MKKKSKPATQDEISKAPKLMLLKLKSVWLPRNGRWVYMMPNIISTITPPAYTMIWLIAKKPAPAYTYNPAIPKKQPSKKKALLKILRDNKIMKADSTLIPANM